jgi:hypothetical protein
MSWKRKKRPPRDPELPADEVLVPEWRLEQARRERAEKRLRREPFAGSIFVDRAPA